jgi:transcriptional regulator with XRE-family HTH domain
MDPDQRESRRLKLIALLKAHDLTQLEAARLLGMSHHTVSAWCKPGTSKSSSPIPPWAIELLELKLR